MSTTVVRYQNLWHTHRFHSHLFTVMERIHAVLNGDAGDINQQQKTSLTIAEKHLTQLEEQLGQFLESAPVELNPPKNGNGNGNEIGELWRLVLDIINNPLTIISLHAQLLIRQYSSTQPECVGPLKTIVTNCARIASELYWLQEKTLVKA